MTAARAQLATTGAAGLSLRSIARDLDMVSSAVYRYVASRDELLTRLIIEAYDDLGDAVERAVASADGDLRRWVAAAAAVRTWAIDRPHEYLLLYGTPVPGYLAPADTVQPGTRVLRILADIVESAHRAGRLQQSDPIDLDTALTDDLETLAATTNLTIAAATAHALLVGWTQMFGLLGFELTNQTRGIVEHHDELFHACATRTGWSMGLR